MKTYFDKLGSTIFRKYIVLIVFTAVVSSCIKEDQAFTTFTGEMIYSYMKKDTTYSEFVKIVDKAGFKGMLSAYGSYTCLAPTNAAFRKYYASFGSKYNFDSLRQTQIDTLVRTHIVINKFLAVEQSDGVLPNVNMDQRVIEIKFTTNPSTNSLKIMLNDSSQIVSRDNEVYNGVIQGINRVLTPSNALLPGLIQKNPDISIFSEALELTHLSDSLKLIKDKNYHPTSTFKDEYNQYDIVTPAERRYGYTALIEDNSVLNSYGISNIDDLIEMAKKLYPANSAYDNDYTNRKNSLNQYISYHLVNKAIFYNTFFYTRDAVKNYTPDEYLETMLTNKIIRVSRFQSNVTLNLNTDYTTIVPADGSKTTINGVYHLLTKMLVYSDNVEKMLQNNRIRFDIVSLFPEMTNNNIRGSEGFMSKNNSSGDRFGFEPGYLADLKMSKDTRLIYLAGKQGQWANFQADELMGLGAYDVTMRLLPVPPGTYELRFGYSANGNRSVTQIYVDNKPIGIPLDLTIGSTDARIGYIADAATDDNGFENDKMMKNRGYMKGPTTFLFGSTIARNYIYDMRRIIGTFTFSDYQPHYLRFKSVTPNPVKQCMMDYFEYVPKSVYSPASGEPEGRD